MKLCRNKLHDTDIAGVKIRWNGSRLCIVCLRTAQKRYRKNENGKLAMLRRRKAPSKWAADIRHKRKHREKYSIKFKEWYSANPEKVRANEAERKERRRLAGGAANLFWQQQARDSI